jgi:hypothetical protein
MNERSKGKSRVNWISWRLCILLACLAAVLGATLFFTSDNFQFVCKLHSGSKTMKAECVDRLYGAKESIGLTNERNLEVSLPPEWAWRYLVSDSDALTRITTASLLWHLHPADGRYVSILVTETDNSDPFIRGCALGEFWNMDECFDVACPILRKHLFEDQDGYVRLAAFNSLLTLSRHHPEARNILAQAARDLPYEATQKSVRRLIESWNQRSDVGTAERIDIDSHP